MTAGSNRREAIGIGLALSATPASAATTGDGATEAEAALMAFLRSFAACDLPAMEAAFAPDATSFDALTAGTSDGAPHRESLKRRSGMPEGMRRIALALPAERSGPPYHRPDLIQDLHVQVEGDVALCTFHFDNPDRLGRRTIVLVRRAGRWRILHVHASNQQF
ncbi:nuclear transport factor 2 family protein [Erythrobacter sp. NE805]|uniref:nuclear transport factor 2 family protein n=1 Tax=Erythrobacter sp. NE805 TaxID=3389875 RepID=UPI00396AF026